MQVEIHNDPITLLPCYYQYRLAAVLQCIQQATSTSTLDPQTTGESRIDHPSNPNPSNQSTTNFVSVVRSGISQTSHNAGKRVAVISIREKSSVGQCSFPWL